MKKKLGLLILLILIFLTSCIGEENRHFGQWSGIDKTGKKATFILGDNGTGKMIGGNNSLDFTYEVDYTKEPFWLDLVINQKDFQGRMKFIMEFNGDNKMRLRTFFNAVRPTEFLPGNEDTIVLNKDLTK